MGIFKTLVNDLFGTEKEYEVKGMGMVNSHFTMISSIYK